MSETQTQENASSMPIEIHSQFVKDLSFENPNAPQIYNTLNTPPQISVNVNVEARKLKEDRFFEVNMTVQANAQNAEGTTVFLVELTYGAVVSLSTDMPDDAIQPFLLIEVPRLLFPFARNIVADATREGGFPPLMINPVDFVALYKAGMEQNAA